MNTENQTVKHTPGPWKYWQNYTGDHALDECRIAAPENRHIAIVPNLSSRCVADASLIAAAPTLLCMLQRLMDEICMSEAAMGHVAPLTLEQARKAIDDAEGRQP